jgi:hypothetical protein
MSVSLVVTSIHILPSKYPISQIRLRGQLRKMENAVDHVIIHARRLRFLLIPELTLSIPQDYPPNSVRLRWAVKCHRSSTINARVSDSITLTLPRFGEHVDAGAFPNQGKTRQPLSAIPPK